MVVKIREFRLNDFADAVLLMPGIEDAGSYNIYKMWIVEYFYKN